MTNNENSFQTLKPLGYACLSLFGLLLFFYVFQIVLSFVQIIFFDSIFNINGDATRPIILISVIEFFESLATLVLGVLFLIWEYKAFKNLPSIKSYSVDFTPGWAVGWWFIPFANFVKPYQAMSELWDLSDPDFDEISFLTNKVGTEKLIMWWWGFFIVGRIASNIGQRIGDSKSLETLELFPPAIIVSVTILAFAAGFAMKLVWQITKNQETKYQKIISLTAFSEPPPPPTFEQQTEVLQTDSTEQKNEPQIEENKPEI